MSSNKKINHALIMAAGRGTRMMPLTDLVPKPMAPFDGSTLIARGIEKVRAYIPNIHITVGYKGGILADHVIKMQVNSVFNTDGKGNSWWVYNTLMRNLDEPIFVLTSDNVVVIDYHAIAAEYYQRGEPTCMVVPVAPVDGLEGDFIVHENNVVKDLNRSTPTGLYCSGIQVLNPKKVADTTQPSDDFHELWAQLIAQGQLHCSDILPEKWVAIDTLEQLSRFKTSNDLL